MSRTCFFLYANNTVVRLECNSIIKQIDRLSVAARYHRLVHCQIEIETKPWTPKRSGLGWHCRLDQIACFSESGPPAFIKSDFAVDNHRVETGSRNKMAVERRHLMIS